MTDAIQKVVDGESLSQVEAEATMKILMQGSATDAQIGSLLTALRIKGESSQEIRGFASAMLAKAEHIAPSAEILLDTCGTGGDQSNSFNISTATALVTAATGITVVKHGNRAVSSQSGSADVLEALGVRLQGSPQEVEDCINKVGIGFLFAPHFHQAAKNVAAPRREIGIRTVFNLLGPLVNPAGATHQLVGVYDPQLTTTLAEVLRASGIKRALVVHGSGLDELTTCGESIIAELHEQAISNYRLTPEECGIPRASASDIAGGTPQENAAIIKTILAGETGAPRDIVVLNSAAALYLCGKSESIPQGIGLAKEAIDSGSAQRMLARLVQQTVQYGDYHG